LYHLAAKPRAGMKKSREKRAIRFIGLLPSLHKIDVLGKRNESSTGYLLVQAGVGELRIFPSPIFNL
jgi:hypothetical protein